MKKYGIMLALLLCLSSVPAQALKFSPFRVKFEPSGTQASKLFHLENDSSKPSAVQMSIASRAIDIDGNETNADAEDDFIIFPVQMALEPNSTKSVRVQWAGEPDIEVEQAYRVVAEQLPVELDADADKNSHIKFLVRYEGALFVTPPNSKHDVSLESYKVKNEADKNILNIVLDNKGTRHAMLKNMKLNVTDQSGAETTLAGEGQLAKLEGETLLAKSKRQFSVVLPASLSDVTNLSFDFDKNAF